LNKEISHNRTNNARRHTGKEVSYKDYEIIRQEIQPLRNKS